MIVIPAIDMRGGKCVRLFQGDYAKETVYGDPVEQALKWEADGAKIIHLVDLDGAKAGHIVNKEIIKEICATVKIPCELGGGIRCTEDARTAFDLGVARVIIGTIACENPDVAEKFIEQFGAEKIVVGIDAKDGRVATRGWIETSSQDAFDLAKKLHKKGVARIIFTDIATDGALCGPNLNSAKALCELLPDCQIIASGGVAKASDVAALAALGMKNLEGVIVGKALYDGHTTFAELDAVSK